MELVERKPARARRQPRTPAAVRGEIELRDVTLRYRDDQAPALDRLNLHVHAGETVALVGPSGAGKSTLVHLLPRFVEPTSGQRAARRRAARATGTSTRCAASSRWSARTWCCSTTAWPPTSRWARPDAAIDRERVRDALRGANLLDFVDGLPQGLDTAIGHNGSQLSGGQRQRLAIARAHLQGRADPDPRRGHLGAGQRIRARGAGGAGPADEGPHHAGHRAPPVDHRTCRPRGRPGGRPRGRTGHACRSCWRAAACTRGCTRCSSAADGSDEVACLSQLAESGAGRMQHPPCECQPRPG